MKLDQITKFILKELHFEGVIYFFSELELLIYEKL